MIKIYHNPHCSKSRATLALLQDLALQQGMRLEIVEYLRAPPTLAELEVLCEQLGGDARAMLRDNEEEFAALQLADASHARQLAAIAAHPRLLQRPIVSYQNQARIGRPPEQVLSLFSPLTQI